VCVCVCVLGLGGMRGGGNVGEGTSYCIPRYNMISCVIQCNIISTVQHTVQHTIHYLEVA
jgi:hypothetical protein